jgi:hypothetical protein
MNRRLISVVGIALVALVAMGATYVNSIVGVCDPATPANCLKPNADGSIPTTPTGSGSAVTIADGADVAQGAKADAAYAGSGAASVVAALKGIYAATAAALPAGTNAIGKVTPLPVQTAPTVTAVTVGAASAQAKAAGTFNYFFIQNVSATASVACQWAGTAALNTAGSFMLPPLAARTWENNSVPNAALNCIATAAATPATIETH